MQKRFWQNLGLTQKDLATMPDTQVRFLGELMVLEDRFAEKRQSSQQSAPHIKKKR